MFNQRKTPPPPPPPPTGGVIRMPSLNRLPGEIEISTMLTHAQSARGKQVKLAWSDDSQQLVPLLTCTWDATASEPRWAMQYGEGPMGKIVWMYDSTDIGLILNFVLGTCTGTVQEVQMNDSFAMDPLLLSTIEISAADGQQRAASTMEGDLVDFSVPSLLQSFGIAAMSGMLSIKGPDGSADVFFQDGNPMHAQALGSFGELALLELFTWEQGKFHFYKGERTDERTINRRLDSIIMEGVTLLDQAKYIRNAGVTPESYLIKKAHGISEAEFDAHVTRGAPIELAVQKRFFEEVDDRTKLFEILMRLQLPKTMWLPTLYQ